MSGAAPRRVLVTGATGFIGRRLIQTLIDRGHAVRALVRPASASRANFHEDCEVCLGELTDTDAVAEALAGVDSVVYGAGAVRGRFLDDFRPANVAGLQTLTEVLGVAAEEPAAVVLLSSLAASRPELSPYAASKREGERVLAAADLARWTVLRPPAVYGPGDVEMRPLFELARRGVLLRPGPRHQTLSLIHVDDLCGAVAECLAHGDACHTRTFSVHDGRDGGYDWDAIGRALTGHRVRQLGVPGWLLGALAYTNLGIATVTGRLPMLTPGKVRELRQPSWVCDNRAFTLATGWVPRIDLATGAAMLFGTPVPTKDDIH
jgi:2-alkyl-3-oxoalkanoate reductase